MNWMKYRLVYFAISLLVLIPGICSLLIFGLRPAIDFTGGTLLEVKIAADQPPITESVESAVQAASPDLSSLQQTSQESWLFRFKQLNDEQKAGVKTELAGFGEVEELRFETVGPTLGQELLRKTLLALVLAAGFILYYVATRFKDKMYGVCAILAMFHDSLILLGVFSLLGHFYQVEVDTLFVTAVLTILSFSVHDTVVVYDRIRELTRINPKTAFVNLVNQAVTETLTRSINNSMTIIFMLLALYLLGGQTTRWFVFALLIGTISGTYSSTFTAAPLLVVWKKLESKKKDK
ncbi:protein translocase subunit SecF [Patescibacteria group bacterium]|nr:protein translocase subunit SecF [Patescibacteria group bacterium]